VAARRLDDLGAGAGRAQLLLGRGRHLEGDAALLDLRDQLGRREAVDADGLDEAVLRNRLLALRAERRRGGERDADEGERGEEAAEFQAVGAHKKAATGDG
jgi:hypothetical protein